VALPVKALKAGQESYWLDQIARNREEYFSGRGESPGRFVGGAAATAGLEGIASPEQVRAMFQGQDPATDELRCAPLPRADPVEAGRLDPQPGVAGAAGRRRPHRQRARRPGGPATRRTGRLAVAVLAGWRLRFRPSEQARTWQRGAHGERHTARLLDRLTRDGY
jgi:hypothetical protein